MRNALTILSVTVLCFFVGGGWKFFSDQEMEGLWHKTNSDLEYFWAYLATIAFCGIAQAVSGFLWTLLIVKVWPTRRRKWWLWAFLLTSFLLGGYKFFVMPSEYFVPPMAAKQASQFPLWYSLALMPFLINGGGAGLVAACVVAAMQRFAHKQIQEPSR